MPQKNDSMSQRARASHAFAWCLWLLAEAGTGAHADDFIVYSPHVNRGQSEIELRGFYSSDDRSAFDGAAAGELSLAHAFTDWWKPEIY
ncbi:MAG TPA: hypothetical protein VJQ83_11600, partial [Tepidiformaceae bacterium]|nr:hypothetical protein [Tepidiformaceae bacterium]